jgi:Rrf2 family transcriptional regulator, iron-sulfur cluster assembly transcription factor
VRLTRAGEYAVRCVLYIASCDPGSVVNSKEIAREMEIPEQFLGKIAQQLGRLGILEIVQGSRGGFRLLVPPERLTLLDVIEAVIGEIFLNDCLMRPDSCKRSPACAVNQVWQKARGLLRDTLRDSTFASLVKTQSCLLPPTSEKQSARKTPLRAKARMHRSERRA